MFHDDALRKGWSLNILHSFDKVPTFQQGALGQPVLLQMYNYTTGDQLSGRYAGTADLFSLSTRDQFSGKCPGTGCFLNKSSISTRDLEQAVF